MNIKELFTWDMKNHNTLIGGWMGIAHGGVTAGIMSAGLFLLKTPILAIIAGAVCALYYIHKETVGLRNWYRSTDSFFDYIVPIAVFVVGSYFIWRYFL